MVGLQANDLFSHGRLVWLNGCSIWKQYKTKNFETLAKPQTSCLGTDGPELDTHNTNK